jgi:N-acetylglucosaminyldiphosphoundecaprenol N-acetyl-beta-D-mannosaminyltransferase
MFKPPAESFMTGNYKIVVKKIVELIISKKKKSVSFLPTSMNDFAIAKKESYSQKYKDINYFLPDGMPLAWWLKHIKKKNTQRIYGPNLMISLLENKKINSKKHFFICPNEKSKKEIDKTIKHKFPNLKKYKTVSLQKNGKDNLKNTQQKINNYQPDIIWIGIGSPRQVEISSQIKHSTQGTSIFCVGAAFSLLIGTQIKTPEIIQNLGLEWAFRLLTEPVRLWKRYLVIIPSYLISELLFFIKEKINKK